jgi:hypothetical protein
MNRHFTRIKHLAGCALVGAAAILAAPAHAGVLNLDSQTPTTYLHGEKFVEGGLTFTARESNFFPGLGLAAGVMLDGSNPGSCGSNVACPSGNGSIFYSGWNDSSIDIGHAGGFYSLNSLRYSFLAPGAPVPDGVYGQLVLNATTDDGSVVTRSADFAGQDANGLFMFSNWKLDADFAALRLTNLSISACLFDGNGGCVNPADWALFNAQFAIDDLDVDVPLPGSAPLLLLGLAGLAAIRRRAR